jgi:hypothetical protein
LNILQERNPTPLGSPTKKVKDKIEMKIRTEATSDQSSATTPQRMHRSAA